MNEAKFHRRGLTATACAIGLLLCARVAVAAQEPPAATATASPAQAPSAPPPAEKPPAAPPTISYAGGQLKIDALDSTLADILTKVAALTGVKIDVPPAASNERMPVVQLGPGPARQILASLLGDSNVDYLIQASDTDPEKIQSVLVMLREKKGARTEGTDAVARRRSPYARGAATSSEPEEAPAPDNPQPENVVPEAISANPQPADQPALPPPAEPGQSLQPGQLNGTRVSPQTVPQALDAPSINQQLQQMYQQRIQINQQERQTGPPSAPTNPK